MLPHDLNRGDFDLHVLIPSSKQGVFDPLELQAAGSAAAGGAALRVLDSVLPKLS